MTHLTPTSARFSLLDKRISLAVLLTIAIQTGSALIWAGQAAQRITHLEKTTPDAALLNERIARLEEQTLFMRDSLMRIEQKLDRTR